MKATAIAFQSHPIFMIATVAASLIGVFGALGSLVDVLSNSVNEYDESVQQLEKVNSRIASIQKSKDSVDEMLARVREGATLTTSEISRYTGALNNIAGTSPTALQAVNDLTKGIGDQETALQGVVGAAEDYIEVLKEEQRLEARKALAAYTGPTNAQAYKDYRRYQDNYQYYREQGAPMIEAARAADNGELDAYLQSLGYDVWKYTKSQASAMESEILQYWSKQETEFANQAAA